MKVFFIILFIFFSGVIQSQEFVGKSVAEVAKSFDSFYVYPNTKTNLRRTVFVKGLEDEAKYLYTYSDNAGIIKIVLDKSLTFPDGNYYGFIDTAIVESPSNFCNGFAIVCAGDEVNHLYGTGKFGMIDSTGKIIVQPQYYNLGKFSEGLATYSELLDNRVESGYINSKGDKVIVLREELSNLYMGCYFRGGDFKNGVAIMNLVENGSDCNCSCTIVIDKSGKILNQDGVLLDANYNAINLD